MSLKSNEVYVPSDFLNKIKWQDGPIPTVGVNGCQVEDVLTYCIVHLNDLNAKVLCEENDLAIVKIREAILWLCERTRDRKSRGVEGTYNP